MNKWWMDKIIYQIYPRSFQDTNGDGYGDIQGIIKRLDILKDLGIDVIWLSPVYKSPDVDNGYDISDYKSINEKFGNMEDMEHLISEAKKRDITIMMDLVINHTSDKHEWFQKSKKRIEPYGDYYIWKKKPNNWTSFFGGKAWSYDKDRKEYYLHLFAENQPDLNYSNPKVLKEIKDIIRFWLDMGICGFRCDVINVFYKNSLENGKRSLILTGSEHYLTNEGTHRLLKEIREDVLDKYKCFTVGETVFVNIKQAQDLSGSKRKELDMVFSFEHMEADQIIVKWFKKKLNRKKFFQTIAKWQKNIEWNANYLENHDQLRSVSRFGNENEYWKESAKLLATMLLTLKGSIFIYQGQEIGMTNYDFKSIDTIQDVESHNIYNLLKKYHVPEFIRMKMINKSSRDNVRTPMQWNSERNAGFTKGNPWLVINENYRKINYQNQMQDKNSILSFYKKLIKIRKKYDILKYGKFKEIEITKNIFIYERIYKNNKMTVALNLSEKTIRRKLSGRLILSNYSDSVDYLRPYEAIILK